MGGLDCVRSSFPGGCGFLGSFERDGVDTVQVIVNQMISLSSLLVCSIYRTDYAVTVVPFLHVTPLCPVPPSEG